MTSIVFIVGIFPDWMMADYSSSQSIKELLYRGGQTFLTWDGRKQSTSPVKIGANICGLRK